MRLITGESMNEIYSEACRELLLYPENTTHSQGTTLKEIQNMGIVLTNPLHCVTNLSARKLSKKYLAGETAFYLAGSDRLDFISHYSKFWRGISDDGIHVKSCYGKRLFREEANNMSQIGYVIEQILAKPDTKKAVALIYKERDTDTETKDNPCTMYLHFALRNGLLHATAHMRSNDIWFGLPYDVFFFVTVQQIVLAAIQEKYPTARLGTYTHIANSFHAYERDFYRLSECAEELGLADDPVPVLSKKEILDGAIPKFCQEEYNRRVSPGHVKRNIGSPFFDWLLTYI